MALLVDELIPDSAHALRLMVLGGASLKGFSYEVFNGGIGRTGVTAMIVASMEVVGPVFPLHVLMCTSRVYFRVNPFSHLSQW